ncbi:MAG: aminotransferase class V-fold PLP-dependent enzyme, partial [Christensenellales bacterium]
MIYLDNAGTTKVSEKVKNAMLPYLDEIYGNASSLHEYGQIAREHLEKAREKVAKLLGAEARE